MRATRRSKTGELHPARNSNEMHAQFARGLRAVPSPDLDSTLDRGLKIFYYKFGVLTLL